MTQDHVLEKHSSFCILLDLTDRAVSPNFNFPEIRGVSRREFSNRKMFHELNPLLGMDCCVVEMVSGTKLRSRPIVLFAP